MHLLHPTHMKLIIQTSLLSTYADAIFWENNNEETSVISHRVPPRGKYDLT